MRSRKSCGGQPGRAGTALKSTPEAVVLTIAGSDSGGGAGIQVDLKVFSALGVFGTSVITALTAQNPQRVARIETVTPAMVAAQIATVLEAFEVKAVKTGMLGTVEIVEEVTDALHRKRQTLKLVVDPILRATSGARLLEPRAKKILEQKLLPLAMVVTPNLDEAAAFLGCDLPMREAAQELSQRWGTAVLLKGGHTKDARRVIDVFYDGSDAVELVEPRVRGVNIHGLGCATSAAIAAFLAQGHSLLESVVLAKKFISQAIRNAVRVGKFQTLRF